MEAWHLRRLVLALICLAPSFAWGQAWLPDEKTLSFGIVHNDIENNDHYLPNGDTIDVGHTRVFNDAFSVAYSPSDRWLMSASVPYVRARYHGTHPHAGTDIDDGRYRGTFTDLRVELHYQALEKPFAFAPFVAAVVPTHNYPTLGHAAPGRRLEEQWIGFFLGRSLDDWLPRTYIQARYSFAFVEKVIGVTHNRSNLDLEFGYFFNSQWSIRGLASWQRTHGGIDVPVPVKSRFYPYHDQLAAGRFFEVGGGFAWAVREYASVYLLYKTSLSGADGHKLNNEFILGLATSFSLGP
jgi:hypothetical protein